MTSRYVRAWFIREVKVKVTIFSNSATNDKYITLLGTVCSVPQLEANQKSHYSRQHVLASIV